MQGTGYCWKWTRKTEWLMNEEWLNAVGSGDGIGEEMRRCYTGGGICVGRQGTREQLIFGRLRRFLFLYLRLGVSAALGLGWAEMRGCQWQ